MPANKKLLMLPGDGIGPEVMNQVTRVIGWMDKTRHVSFDVSEDLIGGACYDANGEALTDKTMSDAMNVDAVLLGAVGGPQWDNVERFHRPEQGLLRLRKDMDLFANLRPTIVFPALAEASSLKSELVAGLDLMIVRELTGGVYFGQPRGIEILDDGSKRAVDTQVYTTGEIDRVCRVAFEMARKRHKRVTSVEKANVMETGVLWRQVATKAHADGYEDVELSHMYADNCAMQLVREPKQFDVIVTDNLFGDILSDLAAQLIGGLGFACSANIGDEYAVFEPTHGSAPKYFGQNKVNPTAMILTAKMMLDWLGETNMADNLERAVAEVIFERKVGTYDVGLDNTSLEVAEAVAEKL